MFTVVRERVALWYQNEPEPCAFLVGVYEHQLKIFFEANPPAPRPARQVTVTTLDISICSVDTSQPKDFSWSTSFVRLQKASHIISSEYSIKIPSKKCLEFPAGRASFRVLDSRDSPHFWWGTDGFLTALELLHHRKDIPFRINTTTNEDQKSLQLQRIAQMADAVAPDQQPPRNGNSSPSHAVNHRSSFAENLRHSPRAQRHPSLGQAAMRELINGPSSAKPGDPRFAGRDWRQIHLGELVQESDVKWAELDTTVEQATKDLINHGPPNVILLRENTSTTQACGTFDYSDLNAYLLVVVGLSNPEESQVATFTALAQKAREARPITLTEIQTLTKKPPFITLSNLDDLPKAIEYFASGVHRIIVCKDDTTEVVGILSQLKLVKFLWDNGQSFPAIDRLYPVMLRDLNVGTPNAIAINGDRHLTDALTIMSNEGLTSIAVVDNAMNVVGNISTADVKLLTKTSSLPLLQNSCIHFISAILTERGTIDGKDSFPVFHVSPQTTLAHTIARLVATKSHRMWIVESQSPSASTPATPLATPAVTHSILSTPNTSTPASPSISGSFPAVSAAALPGARMSGRLTGVISLTDILNLFARQSGLNPLSPTDSRDRRRRSSSSSVRPSFDMQRASSVEIRR